MGDKPIDIAESWRQMLRDWEKQTNAAMTGVSATPEYNQVMSKYLAAGLRMQGMYADGLEQALVKLNLPSRSDFRQVYAQLSEIEARLDRLTAAVENLVEPGSAPKPAGPARTRKPPAAKAAD